MRARFNRLLGVMLGGFPLVFACSSTDRGRDDEDEAGPNGDDAEGGSCVPKLETCSQNGDCCGFANGNNYCVDTGSSAICAIACTSGSECESGCCAALQGGGSVCAPSSYCPDTSCRATGSSCTRNGANHKPGRYPRSRIVVASAGMPDGKRSLACQSPICTCQPSST